MNKEHHENSIRPSLQPMHVWLIEILAIDRKMKASLCTEEIWYFRSRRAQNPTHGQRMLSAFLDSLSLAALLNSFLNYDRKELVAEVLQLALLVSL